MRSPILQALWISPLTLKPEIASHETYNMTADRKSILFASLAVLFWSTVATAFKLSLQELSPFELLQISVYTSAAVLFLILLSSRQLPELLLLRGKDLILVFLLALLNPVLYYQILFFAYDRLPAQTAQVLNFTWPVMIVLFSFLFGLERFNLKKFSALALSFFGTFIVVAGFSFSDFRSIDTPGAVLAFSSSFVWAAFWIIGRKNHLDPLVSLFSIFLTASILISLQAFFQGNSIFSGHFGVSGLDRILPAVYVGIFEMSLTFTLWMNAMKLSNNTPMLSNLIYLSPFLSLLFIRFILNEAILPRTFIGLLLIVAGIFLQWHLSRTE